MYFLFAYFIEKEYKTSSSNKIVIRSYKWPNLIIILNLKNKNFGFNKTG